MSKRRSEKESVTFFLVFGKSYLQTSKKWKAIHEKKWAWGPGEDTGLPEMAPETPAAAGVTGVDVLMEIAAGEE